ncbi:MAG TPA: Si-specific NAD(P)(+) transhydrogenase [Gemmatimonadaceae bacterium]|nr:Si-specific NAD(P)(+) transhydrogenase [Gemmatimonadaceae bacterium]
MSEHYDLVVIGAGPAGEKGAAQAAYFGKRVCVIERAPKPGGAAVNTGTIPSKTLRETALYFSGLRQRGLYAVDLRVKHDITIGDFMQRERSVVETEWSLIDDNLRRHDITSIQGAARLADGRTIDIERYGEPTRRITGDVVLIATGSHPQRPEGFEVDGAVVVDSDSLLTLERIPARMIVIGGGVIGCEYACTFAALGVRVTIVNNRARLLAHLDAEVSEALRQQMTARLGIAVHLDSDVARVAMQGDYADVTLTDGTTLSADCVLYSAGRNGNTDGLGLEALGVKTNARGYVQVDDHFHTGVAQLYAAGDVIGFPALASTSMEQARVAVCHAFDLKYKQRVASLLPYGVWTLPEIATVGESEDSLKLREVPYEIGRASFRLNPRGQIIGDLDGFVKLLFHLDDQRVLGISIVGEGACELIHVGMACMSFGGTLDFFIQSVFNYPSLADAYKYAAYDGLQALARRYARNAGLPTSGSHPAITES